MTRILLIIIIVFLSVNKFYSQQIEVLTLGVFHFDFPNLDAVQTSDKDQIDVLLPKYQDEIEMIAKKLAQFNPNVIVVERPMNRQGIIDSLFNAYMTGQHNLSRSEVEQLSFRIAKKCNSKIYCADARGEHTAALETLLNDEQSNNYIAFENSFSDNSDSLQYFNDEMVFKQKGILAQLIRLNDPDRIKKVWVTI